MLRERIQEIVDFAKSESPYRSANKGWLTDDIYLQLGSKKNQDSTQFDQLIKVSFFWQPIIKIVSVVFVVISVSTFLAFSPLALSNGRYHFINEIFELGSKEILPVNEGNSSIESISKPKIIAKEEKAPAFNKANALNESIGQSQDSSSAKSTPTRKKVITASDLFQAKRN